MILSISAPSRGARVSGGNGKRSSERLLRPRTGSLISLGPKIGDSVVDLFHLETVELHDGAEERGTSRHSQPVSSARRRKEPRTHRELCGISPDHRWQLPSSARRGCQRVQPHRPRVRSRSAQRTLTLTSSILYLVSMSLYSVSISSRLLVRSERIISSSPPSLACCEV